MEHVQYRQWFAIIYRALKGAEELCADCTSKLVDNRYYLFHHHHTLARVVVELYGTCTYSSTYTFTYHGKAITKQLKTTATGHLLLHVHCHHHDQHQLLQKLPPCQTRGVPARASMTRQAQTKTPSNRMALLYTCRHDGALTTMATTNQPSRHGHTCLLYTSPSPRDRG